MGPVNWIAVILAWVAAALVGVLFYGRAAMPLREPARHAAAALLLLISATMIGHMFARVGPTTLAAKPWLYFMMSGGLALTFIGPGLFITAARRGYPTQESLKDYGVWVVAYLAMGAVFWATG